MNWLDELQREVDAALDLVRVLKGDINPCRTRPIMTLEDVAPEPKVYFPYEDKKD